MLLTFCSISSIDSFSCIFRAAPKLRGFGRGKLLPSMNGTNGVQENGFGRSRSGFGKSGGFGAAKADEDDWNDDTPAGGRSGGGGFGKKTGGFGGPSAQGDGWNDDAPAPSFGGRSGGGFGSRGGGFGGGRGEFSLLCVHIFFIIIIVAV